MAEMLLINPRKRTRRAAAKRRVVRRKNPVTPLATKAPARRRRNPIGLARVARRVHRRRRNPIGGVSSSAITAQLKTALMGGAGAVAMDVVMGQIVPFLPASLLPNPTGGSTISVYDAVKAAATIALGEILNKSTKGMSRKLASGALTVQSYQILHTFVPVGMSLGYMSPANVVRGTSRLQPNMTRMGAYTPGQTALLSGQRGVNAYQTPGRGSLLSGARQREAMYAK